MAQKTEKEETEFNKAVHEATTKTTPPPPPSLCVNNCGVKANGDLCQNCLNAKMMSSSSSFPSTAKPSTSLQRPSNHNKKRDSTTRDRTEEQEREKALPEKKVVNRCFGCRRKVGLTGFRCRCGELFCAEHRYSDRHDCSFDYKAAGREAIARENPVVKAPKIVRV